MLRKLLFGWAILFLASTAFAQTYLPYNNQAVINQNGLRAAAFAQITVCNTTFTTTCSSKPTIYSNSTGAGGPKANPFAADQNGNYTFWIAAGVYYIQTQPSHTPPVTPFPFVIGGAGGAGSVTSVAATGDGVVLASSVSGSPVTSSGTLAFSLANAGQFTILANNTSGSAHPTYVTFAALFGGDCATALTITSNVFGCNSGIGTGTVTEIDTTAPIVGGPITSTGPLSCPTCVVASSPAAGVAHFPGSSQTASSSVVVGSDFGASIAANSWFGNGTGSPAAPAFNTSAIPVSILPSSVVQNNQGNTYSTGTQSFAAAAHLYLPVGASAAGATNGEAAFNSTSKNYVGFDNGAASTFASFATALAPVNANCVVWINSGGHIGLGDAGTNCGGGGGGSGTVTSFSAGNLSPLFTSSVATSTTTPALTFALTNAGINTVFAGPPSGSPGAPSYQTAPTISAANMTNFPAANTPVEIQSTAYLAADTNYGSDDTTALQSAITAACTTPGGTLVIAAGQYKVTSALVLPNKGCHVRGVGTNGGGPGTGGPQLASVSIGCFTSSIAAMTSGTISTANYQGPWIENIQFVDKTGGGTCGGGLLLINQSYSTLTNVGFQGFALAKTSAPSTPALTPGTSGSLAAGTYFVAISDTDDIGHETLTGTAISATTTGSSGSIALASHTPTSPMTKFNVYAGATAATLHLITQGHATGTYTITALANSNVASPFFDESAGYGVTTLGTAGGYGTLSGGFSNQNVLNNVQVFGGTLNGIVADRNNSATFVNGGNLNLASNTSGCGGIFAYGNVTTHTESGGSGSTRICVDNYGGTYNIGLDMLASGEVGLKAISLGQATVTTTSSVTSGTPTVISLDSLSNHNNVVALGTGSASAITDAGTFNQKYDAQAQTNVVPFATTLPALTITGITGSTQAVVATSAGLLSGIAPNITVNSQNCPLAGSCNVPFQTNGVNNPSQAGINVVSSSLNTTGLTWTASSIGGNQTRGEVGGLIYSGRSATTLALASVPTQCSAGQLATGIAANGNANCSGVANITITVATTLVPANSCLGPFTPTMTGFTTSMTLTFVPITDVSGLNGWGPANQALYFSPVLGAGVAGYKVCNATSSNVTPGGSTTWNVSAK